MQEQSVSIQNAQETQRKAIEDVQRKQQAEIDRIRNMKR